MSKKQKILILSHEYPPINSGGSTLVAELPKHLVALGGYTVKILTAQLPNTEALTKVSDDLQVLRFPCFRKSVGNASHLELLLYGFFGFFRAFYESMVWRPDFVLSIFLVPSGFIGWLACTFLPAKHIVYVGGADLPNVESKFGLMLKRLTPLLRLILRKAKRILVLEGLEDLTRPLAPEKKLISVRCGTTLKGFPWVDRSARTYDQIQLLTVGRLIERKGFLWVINAIAALPEQLRNRIHYTIVGYGPLENELKLLIQKHGLEKNVTLRGEVKHENVFPLFSQADVYIFYASPEGTSLAMVEAMATGMPIITSDEPGNRELCQGNGFLVPYRKVERLTSCLEDLLNSTNQFQTWGKKSREIAHGYDWHEIAKVYDTVFRG